MSEPRPVDHATSRYDDRRVGAVRLVGLKGALSWAEDIVGTGQTLHEWAAEQPDAEAFRGRGRVYAVNAPKLRGPDRRDRWAVRHYHRGGAMESVLDDRYVRVGTPRPVRELEASSVARSRGVRTPAVMVAAVYPDGPYYRGDLVTEVVPSSLTLADVLHTTDGTRGWLDAMEAAGQLVNRIGDSGLFHVDLNAHNIVFEDGDVTRPWVVDLDKARILRQASSGAKERMRARLTRSIVKVGTPTGEPLGENEVLRALRGDGAGKRDA